MKYLFKELEVLTDAILTSPKNESCDLETFENLKHEVKAIKARLKDIYFKHWSDLDFENFTKLHHETLIEMLQNVLKHLDDKKTAVVLNPDVSCCLKDTTIDSVYAALEGLLLFIHKYFDRHIPKQQIIPELLRGPLLLEVKGFKKSIANILSAQEDQTLVSYILKPFVEFIQKSHSCTWHNLFYCRVIQSELVQLIKHRNALTTRDLFRMLYDLNYNSNHFYRYFIEYINKTSDDNYLQHLYSFQKKIRQINIKANVVYKPHNISLSNMVEKWFDEEIRYLELTQQLKLDVSTGAAIAHEGVHHKILANVSVSELAYIFKLFEETKIITIENHKDFFQTITRTFRTNGSENISFDSLRNKFYNPESHCLKAMKDRLEKIIKKII